MVSTTIYPIRLLVITSVPPFLSQLATIIDYSSICPSTVAAAFRTSTIPSTISYSYSYPFFRVSFVTSETSSDLAFTLSWLLRLDAMCPPAAASRTEYSQQKVLANKNERSLSSRFSYINKLSDITSRRLRIQKNKCQFVHKKMSITERKEKKCNK